MRPLGATRIYINVVHGRKIKPNNGQIKLLKTAVNRVESINHHTKIARRGPNNSRVVNKQHIVSLLIFTVCLLQKNHPFLAGHIRK